MQTGIQGCVGGVLKEMIPQQVTSQCLLFAGYCSKCFVYVHVFNLHIILKGRTMLSTLLYRWENKEVKITCPRLQAGSGYVEVWIGILEGCDSNCFAAA